MNGFPEKPSQKQKKSPRIECAGILSYVIEVYVPNNGEDRSNGKEEKSGKKNTSVVVLFRLAELTLAIIGITLVPCSAHGDKGKHHVSQNKPDTYKCAFTADVQHARKKRHQYARYEERVG